MQSRTTTQILDSLRDPANSAAWRQFDERFRPVLAAFARRRGLSDDDAEDVAQAALGQFAADYREGRYDRTRGRLSSWLIGIAQNRAADALRRRRRDGDPRGESALAHVADDAPPQSEWGQAVQRAAFERALRALRGDTRLSERTVRAFELAALRHMPAEAVAAECAMTVSEVYVAKNRVIKKLREIVEQFTREYDEA